MNRKLKMLGFAAITALALSAVGASGASGVSRHFVSEVVHTVLDAEKSTTNFFKVTGGALQIECENVSVSSTVSAATVTEVTAIPTYTICTRPGENRILHINMTSCAYVFTATKTNGGVEGGHPQVHIECSAPGDEIHIKMTTVIGQFTCLAIPAQTPTGGGVTYETGEKNARHDITVNATVSGITYTEQGFCGSSTGNDGTYSGKVTVSGTTLGGNSTGITWT